MWLLQLHGDIGEYRFVPVPVVTDLVSRMVDIVAKDFVDPLGGTNADEDCTMRVHRWPSEQTRQHRVSYNRLHTSAPSPPAFRLSRNRHVCADQEEWQRRLAARRRGLHKVAGGTDDDAYAAFLQRTVRNIYKIETC